MDIRNIVIISLVLLIAGPAVAADAQLGRLVKEQQNNDNAAFKDRKIEQKDVFSDAIAKKKPIAHSRWKIRVFKLMN